MSQTPSPSHGRAPRSEPPSPSPSRGDILASIGVMVLVGGATTALALMGVQQFLPAAPRHGGPGSAQGAAMQPMDALSAATPVPTVVARTPDFGDKTPTPSARAMANWVMAKGDNGRAPFVILDKKDARLYVFQPDGHLLDTSPVLLGLAPGDDSVPGIGQRPIPEIKPEERTTPAGRFVTQPGKNLAGEEIVWVDYPDAISMHRVRPVAFSEHRLERLATPTPTDNRISYGCINVPVKFFNQYIAPTFGRQQAVAYVIPEVKTIAQVFDEPHPVMASLTGAALPQDTSNR